MMVFTRCYFTEQFGALREVGGDTRKAGETIAESLVG